LGSSGPSEDPPISSVAASAPARVRTDRAGGRASTALSVGVISTFLIIVVVLPLAALLWESKKSGAHGFWQIVSSPEAVAALKLTFGAAFIVVLINGVLGTITAWVLVRDDFRGKALVNAVIDLPFALPTIVAGLTLLALYGPRSPVGAHVAYTRGAIVLALCFVTLPFVVRTVQPVLLELDVEMEEAARSLGAGQLAVFRRIVLPNLLPGILSGVVLALARALGEIGSIVVISGNIPYHTEVASVFIFNQIESGYPDYAAAVAIVLLAAAFVLLLAVGALRFFATRHERA
jgi:sulfate/thiosulfate transport system permease protein